MSAAIGNGDRPAYAHTLPDSAATRWEPLEKHLQEVGRLAESFAVPFGAAEWGAILGLCHDLGKYSSAFQNYLLSTADPDAGAGDSCAGRVDHSTFGARYVAEGIGGHRGQLLAYCIAGHHAGLPDGASDEEDGQKGTLRYRLNGSLYSIPEVVHPGPRLQAPGLRIVHGANSLSGFQLSLFVRMLFSCLVDADRLATEHFCDPEQANRRTQRRPTMVELKRALDGFLALKQSSVEPTQVNRLRAGVLDQCRKAAQLPPGFFSLNVPTGGGKTLSSLAFALDHASLFDLRRVIFAIPFTSIIEQTADAFRAAFGALAEQGLIEHHTNIDPHRDTRSNQFGTENWD